MYDIDLFAPGKLTQAVADQALRFIRRRFHEVWGINRYDVTSQRVNARYNVLLRNGIELLGCLGIEPDGELSNACIEHRLAGISLLTKMVTHAVEHVDFTSFYAETPVDKLASAIGFTSCGFRIGDPPRLGIIVYPERPIVLARLELTRVRGRPASTPSQTVEQQLETIRSLRNHVANIFKLC